MSAWQCKAGHPLDNMHESQVEELIFRRKRDADYYLILITEVEGNMTCY